MSKGIIGELPSSETARREGNASKAILTEAL